MSLFTLGDFTLHAGGYSEFLIDCSVLTDEDLDAIAFRLVQKLPEFGSVEGIPRGGLRLAATMEKYVTLSSGRILVVDDVYTTGLSMELARGNRHVTGAVVFARTKPAWWVVPLFQL